MDTKTYRNWFSAFLLGASCAAGCGGATDDGPGVANTNLGGANSQGGSAGDTGDPGGSGGSAAGQTAAGQGGKAQGAGKGGSAGKGGTGQAGQSGKGGSGPSGSGGTAGQGPAGSSGQAGSGPAGGAGGPAGAGGESGGASGDAGAEQGGTAGTESGGSEQGGTAGTESGGSEQGGTAGSGQAGSEQGGTAGTEQGGAAGSGEAGAAGTGGSIGAPDGWTCNATYYNEGPNGLCDCACGPHDPDCDLPVAVTHCPEDLPLCDKNDQCMAKPPPPAGWTCEASSYGDGIFCDCSCGAPDPDCKVGQVPDYGCNKTQVCDAQGVCTGGTPTPPEWTCPADYFGDGTYCDCDCGAYDVDCKDAGALDGHCNSTQTCNHKTGACVGGIPTPKEWTCKASDYSDGFSCDCGCGIVDPDCKDPSNGLFGCNPSNTGCSATGECTGGTPTPKEWTCDTAFYSEGSANGSCDCGCGVRDPDCDLPGITVTDTTCPIGKTCMIDDLVCH